MKTREQFVSSYRSHLLGYLAECYCSRRLAPSEVGMELDRQFTTLSNLLGRMWDELQQESDKPLPARLPAAQQEPPKPFAQPRPQPATNGVKK